MASTESAVTENTNNGVQIKEGEFLAHAHCDINYSWTLINAYSDAEHSFQTGIFIYSCAQNK